MLHESPSNDKPWNHLRRYSFPCHQSSSRKPLWFLGLLGAHCSFYGDTVICNVKDHQPAEPVGWGHPGLPLVYRDQLVPHLHLMCDKANNIPCQYAWRQSRFRENIPYGAPSAALCVESNLFTVEESEWVTCVLVCIAFYTKYPRASWNPFGHVLNSEYRGLKALLPLLNYLEVHSVSQPLFNLFCFVRWGGVN